MAVVGAAWYTQIQKQRDNRLERAQHNHERQIANEQAEIDRSAADERAKTELKIAEDYQSEAALQAYINAMSELLLEKQLRKSQPNDEVRKIARIRTLTVLHRLDGKRQISVLQFLNESDLINKSSFIVDLKGVDLHETELHGAKLRGAIFINANFCGADLRGANLREADLRGANLRQANLRGANLRQANLREAIFTSYTDNASDIRKDILRGGPFGEAILNGADLRDADLTYTRITLEQLKSAKSYTGATKSDGSKYS